MGLERLKRRAEFLRARRGRKWAARGLVLQSIERSGRRTGEEGEADPARLGFTVTKKVGNAVARNRVRRRLKEAARLIGAELARPGYDYVLIGRRSTLSRGFPDLLDDMRTAFREVHATRPRSAGKPTQGR